MPWGPEWKAQRKQYQSVLLSTRIIDSIRPLQAAESTVTLSHLLNSPERWFDHIRRYSSAIILSSVFGTRGPEFDSPYVQRLFNVQDEFTAIMETGATPPIDIFPILKNLPDFVSPWRRLALDIRSRQRALYFDLLNSVKQRLSVGRTKDCFMDKIVEDTTIDDEHLAYIGGVMMEGGSDSTAGTLLTFALAMAKYPRVLKKLQESVDSICGDDRAPTFEDLEHLPYVKHIMTELIRWRPVAAEGVPHVLIQDDVYGDYHFPQGTIFLANTWAIHHDSEYYDNPEEFFPERFEQNEFGFKDKSLNTDGFRTTYGFGAGRRVCPAQKLAENSLQINIAKLAWAFDILPGADPETGFPLRPGDLDTSPETAWRPGFITAPKEFPAVFKLRSPKYESIIEREFQNASTEVLSRYED
jgi:cytochrome P450 family 619